MADHDPLCVTPYKQQATCASCVLVARVRADERERIVAELDGPAQESEAMYAHAEAVAARLVEVICDLDWQLGDDRVICDALIVQLQHERAEVAALRERFDRVRRERDAARADAAALRERFRFSEYPNGKVRSLIVDGTHWVSVAYANGQEERGAEKARRDVLADLRAKANECSTVGEVIALIEEAGQ